MADGIRFGPYNPGIANQAGLIWQRGLEEFGQNVAQGIQNYEQQKELGDQRDAMFHAIYQTDPNSIDPDALGRYNTASWHDKNKMALEAQFRFLQRQKQQQLQDQRALQTAQIAHATAQADLAKAQAAALNEPEEAPQISSVPVPGTGYNISIPNTGTLFGVPPTTMQVGQQSVNVLRTGGRKGAPSYHVLPTGTEQPVVVGVPDPNDPTGQRKIPVIQRGGQWYPVSQQPPNPWAGLFTDQTQGGGQGGANNPVRVQTPDQARQLPAGTLYQTPDGVIRQVPAAQPAQ